jgi:uncharacterized membrane protein YdbT with pleckstrin-like domain
MAWPDEHLSPEERVVLRARPHPKTPLGPAVALVVIVVPAIVAAGYATTIPTPGVAGHTIGWHTIADLVILVAAVLLVAALTVRPFLTWATTRFAVTTERVTSRAGIVTRRGIDIPLKRVVSVNVTQSVTDRLFGCGSLLLESASEQPLVFDDIPRVEDVHTLVYQAINDDSEGAGQ